MQGQTVTTFLFADIEGSTRLWEQHPERMRPALARHDAIARAAVASHSGIVVKMIGDGVHAAFDDPLDALQATLEFQQALAAIEAEHGIALRVRCGLHAGVNERRDNDYYGSAVNRAARIASAAHGGQILLSQAVVTLIAERLPADVQLRDLGNVRLRDLTHAERVFQVLHPKMRSEFPPLRALEEIPHNLPSQVTSFIGRKRELADIQRLLAHTRLVTLLGAGGLGKTRLSLQIGAAMLDHFPDGVWFVELASLTDAGRVAQTIASVLGAKEEPARPIIEALVKYVTDRRLLVILDNCEHLVQSCAEVAAQLLRAGPHMKILASSREPLRVSGETTYPVPALSLPDATHAIALDTLPQYEAVRLFVERASAAQPSFRLTERNASAVVDICRRVDGIPLALELAAACVRTLSVERIATRLEDRFTLLRGGDRTALPRQQTLRALIDWSYDLLEDMERTLFRRLAVFAGGFVLEAAEGLGADGDIKAPQVLDLLTRLVEKSLVGVDLEHDRYRMLETVRHYAQERLDESGEAGSAGTMHLAYFLALAEKARPELIGPDQAHWLAKLDAERENILAAHAFAARAPDGAQQGLRLISAVKYYWMNRGLLQLGYRTTTEALTRPRAELRNDARCRALFDAGQIANFMGRYGDAQKHLEESLRIARELQDRTRIASVLQPLAMASHGQGNPSAALSYLEEALDLAREIGDRRQIAGALNALAQVHRVEGDLDQAGRLYEQMLSVSRDLGDRDIVAVGLLNLAMVAITTASVQRARAMLVEVFAIVDDIGSKQAGQCGLDVCAGLAVVFGDFVHAARLYGGAETLAAQTGIRRDPTDSAFLMPLIARAREAIGHNAFASAEQTGRALAYDQALAQARDWLASRAS